MLDTIEAVAPPKAGHMRIADGLRDQILSGDYPPGAQLPLQATLARTYGVSLLTSRRAIDQLKDEGLVTPVQGHGSFVKLINRIRLCMSRYVRATPTSGPWQTACDSQGKTGVVDVMGVSHRAADRRVAEALDLTVGEGVVLRQTQMRVVGDERVMQLQDTWLPRWLVDGTPLATSRRTKGGIYNGVAAIGHRPVVADEEVIARMPTREEARAFRLRAGCPVLDARRIARDSEGTPVVYTHVVGSADHISFTYSHVL